MVVPNDAARDESTVCSEETVSTISEEEDEDSKDSEAITHPLCHRLRRMLDPRGGEGMEEGGGCPQ